MNRLRIYISGPITKGDRVHNFAQAARAQEVLISHGFAPLNPMLTMMHPCADQIPYEHWLATDLAWIEVADAVLAAVLAGGSSRRARSEATEVYQNGVPTVRHVHRISTS